MKMNVTSAAFGGVKVSTPRGTIAINAGGELDEMDKFYLDPASPLVAMVLTSVQERRSRHAAEFASRHGIPLIGSFLAFAAIHLHTPETWAVFLPRMVTINGIRLDLFFVSGGPVSPAISPFALSVSVGDESIGVVPDGRLNEKYMESVEKLRACGKIFFGNKIDRLAAVDSALRDHCRSCSNTSAELAELFRDHRGEMIMDPNCP